MTKRKLIQELQPYCTEATLNTDGTVILNYSGMPSKLFESVDIREILAVTYLFGYPVKFGKVKYKIKTYSYQEHRDKTHIYTMGIVCPSSIARGRRTISATLILEAV